MKVTVKDYLNVRVGKPRLNAPCYQYLAPGTELIVDGKHYPGDTFEGIDTWMKDEAGNYYWSGGISLEAEKLIEKRNQKPLLELIDYSVLISNLSTSLSANKGFGINVAVLDSGVYQQHPDLNGAFSLPSIDFTSSATNSKDLYGHGTHVAGLIGGRSSLTGICGVASDCIIHNIKVITDDGNVIAKNLNDAFSFINTEFGKGTCNIDIVNMSLDVPVRSYQSILTELTTLSGNVIPVASAGENERLLDSIGPYCPAYFNDVISVGAIDQNFLAQNQNPSFHKRVDYIMPLMKLNSCGITESGYLEMEGSSMATALVSGIIALLLSNNNLKGKGSTKKIRTLLDQIAVRYSPTLNLSTLQLIKP